MEAQENIQRQEKERPHEAAPKGERIPLYQPQRVQLPEQVIPDRSHITILDSGNEGANVGMALAGLINYLTSRRDGSPFWASPRMLFQMARRYDGFGDLGDIEGTTMEAALYGWQKHGVVREEVWPFVPGKKDIQPDPNWEELARPFTPQSYERVTKDVRVIKAAIVERGAVFAGAMVHHGWWSPERGIIPYPSSDRTSQGAIAVNLLGYTTEGFIIQNAWGMKWGNLILDGESYPGMAIWTYPDFEANALDAYVVRLWPGAQAAAGQAYNVRAGYLNDSPRERKDYLNIMPEVRAISAVLAARDVKPPLALGLFGNWGTGKSFFMDRLRKEIKLLAEMEKAKPGSTPYCQPIVQIEFNAWHYLDTNLWASLVSSIFERLHEAIRQPEPARAEAQRRLIQELGEAQGLYRQSQLELKEAQQDLQIAETGLVISQVAQAVGAENFATTSTELIRQVRQLFSFKVRARKLFQMLSREQGRLKRWIWLALLMIGAAGVGGLVSWLAQAYPETFSRLAQWINASWTWAVGAVAWLGTQLRSVDQFLKHLQKQSDKAVQMSDNQKAYLAQQLEKEKDEKGDVLASVKLAEEKKKEAEERVEQLQRDLEALSPRWQMNQYILERSASEDYRSQLGLISLIRKDFDKLSSLLEASERETPPEGAEKTTPLKLPFERIIIYIDDLDRCTPRRVVDVLEAVHLLLSFPLFVVVVAVDPRWLRTCLEMSYPELLSEQEAGMEEALDQPATPQDYLEKIFQIPFYLRPIDRYGYSNMIRGLVEPDVDPESRPAAAPAGTPGGAGQPGSGGIPNVPGVISAPAGNGAGETQIDGEGHEEEEAFTPVNPDLLKFKAWESDDLQRLSPLFRTPRAVKRFINTYRLVKVGIDPDTIERFEGQRETPGTSRIAQVLLAVVAGYPNQAQRFLQRLLDQVYAEKPAKTWKEFLTACKAQPGFPAVAASGAGDAGQTKKSAASTPPRAVEASEREWLQLCEALLNVSEEGFLPEDLEGYIEMVKHVARFSFSVSDLPSLRRK